MGLIARARHLAKVDEFKAMFEEIFGMTVEAAKVKLTAEQPKPFEITSEIKEKIKQKNEKSMSPEELVEIFAHETEEFYPNGDAPKH